MRLLQSLRGIYEKEIPPNQNLLPQVLSIENVIGVKLEHFKNKLHIMQLNHLVDMAARGHAHHHCYPMNITWLKTTVNIVLNNETTHQQSTINLS
jgi:hypothetical protein